jgi:hypothetical protein
MHRESVSSRADHAVRVTYLNLTGPLIPDSSHQQFRPVFNRSNRQNRSRPESEVKTSTAQIGRLSLQQASILQSRWMVSAQISQALPGRIEVAVWQIPNFGRS